MSEKSLRRIELVLTVIGMLGAFFIWADARWAHSDVVETQFTSTIEATKELKGEVDALYLHMIPLPERTPIRYPAGRSQ